MRAEPAAARRAGMGQQLGHLDHVVERVGPDHAELARERVEGLEAPASEPVCAIAALRPPSDWPSFSATICLPAARAMRQAALNARSEIAST